MPNQPPNPLVDKFLQSLTNAPIQSIDHPATPRQETRVNVLLPPLGGSKAQSAKTQSEGSQSNPSSPRRLRSNSKALGTTTQDARASLSRPNRFQQKQQILKQQRRENYFRHCDSVKKPRYNPHLHYQLTKVFSLWEIVFWDHKGRNILFRILPCYHSDLWYPCRLLKYSPPNDTESIRTHIQANNLITNIHNISP